MNYKDIFIEFWNSMKIQPMFASMADTVENSPWHREDNVLVHTVMVVEEFLKLWTDSESKPMYMAAIAATFHDVGKPAAEEVRESAERGVYRRYAGHEHVSAIAWLEYALIMTYDELVDMGLAPHDVYLIAWMIENHLPYDVKDKTKRLGLFATASSQPGLLPAFTSLLRADARGRISDDHVQKLERVEAWIAEFEQLTLAEDSNFGAIRPRAYVLIGQSSSGKSTVRKYLCGGGKIGAEAAVFSMDEIRLSLFPSEGTAVEQYNHAFRSSVDGDPQLFTAAVESKLNEVFSKDTPVVISDNCNLSKKARNAFIARARQKGYCVEAVLMLTHPNVAVKRQDQRDDRSGVPIWGQFNALTVPTLYSEVDQVQVLMTNWTD